MKIAVIMPLFALAGVPLAQVRFARALAKRGHDVELIIGHIPTDYSFEAPENIKILVLNKNKVRSMLWPLVLYLRAERPDVVFSAEDHLNVIVLLAGLFAGTKAKISGSSRVTPFDTFSNFPFSKRWFLKQLTKAVMWRADALTCVSQGTVNEFCQIFHKPPHVCVYNVIDDQESRFKMTLKLNHPWVIDKSLPLLVAAGRLAPWKGYANLIVALKLLSSKRLVRLIILGDGPLMFELQALIVSLNMSDYIRLEGYVENPLKYYMHADVFVHSALVESLGNVLVEAMMCGLTVVATDCPTGPREVLGNGKYGYLVPVDDPKAMSDAISQALDNPIPRHLLEEAIIPFEANRVINRHFELLGLNG